MSLMMLLIYLLIPDLAEDLGHKETVTAAGHENQT